MTHRRVYFELTDGTVVRPEEDCAAPLFSLELPPPKPRIVKVEIDGRDGSLDMSEWAGRVLYEDRTIKIGLRSRGHHDISALLALNGQRMKVRFSDDPGSHFAMRCTGITRKIQRFSEELTLEFAGEPYKQRERVIRVNGSQALTLALQSRRPSIPTFLSAAQMTVSFDGEQTVIPAGQAGTVPGLELTAEPQEIGILASADVTIVWTDGDL